MTKEKWMERNGFTTEGITFAIVGGNTFEIKDFLKEKGYKFNHLLLWHGTEELTDLPEGFHSVQFSFDELYNWLADWNCVEVKNNAHTLVAEKTNPFLPENPSKHYGVVGQRYYDIPVVVKDTRSYSNAYGGGNIYTFTKDDYTLVWFTQTHLEIKPGDEVLLTGTVKKHDEFRRVKQTHLSRCKVKEG